MVAEIIINSSVRKLNKTFDYNIPQSMEDDISLGSRVIIPFGVGENRTNLDGIVVNIKKNSEYKLKSILKIKDEFVLSEFQIKLAMHIAKINFCNTYDVLNLMLPPGTNINSKKNVKAKIEKGVFLNKEFEEIELYIETGKISNPKHIRVLNYLKDNQGVTIPELILISDTSRAVINTLLKKEYIVLEDIEIDRNPFLNLNINRSNPLKLTQEQEEAVRKVDELSIKSQKFREFLLYGVTGSGKTEVYMQIIDKVISQKKTALVLVPEISLTPQMVERFANRFGDVIAILHSKLSIGERYDQWRKIYNQKCKIVIGARSAIFAPIKNLGIIIIDEEHDMSYKSDTTPRYNTSYVAKCICTHKNIPLLVGSATPGIDTYYKACNNKIELLKLTKRANESNLPEISIVDMKEELENGNKSIFSRNLYEEIKRNLENKEQTILFLNRRGYSTFVMCRDCGYVAKCRNCNISLTYHSKENKLKCHYCGYEIHNHLLCPVCKSKNIRYFGAGTQKIQQEVEKLFPNASTIRMDIDTVTTKGAHEKLLNKFKGENIDILIGTQMVVKGHHFPNVTLVGVLAADTSLNVEDFRAGERTYQTLTQVSGRAGRGTLKGRVVIQTYNPDDYSIIYSKENDFISLYSTEIKIRNQLKYPPFCDIFLIGITGTDEKEVIQTSYKIYDILKVYLKENINIFTPIPAPISKIKNNYRWRLIIKYKLDNNIINIINNMLDKVEELKLKNTHVYVDVNPNNMG